MSQSQWYVWQNDAMHGPFSDTQLQQLVRDGVVGTDALVRNGTLLGWENIRDLCFLDWPAKNDDDDEVIDLGDIAATVQDSRVNYVAATPPKTKAAPVPTASRNTHPVANPKKPRSDGVAAVARREAPRQRLGEGTQAQKGGSMQPRMVHERLRRYVVSELNEDQIQTWLHLRALEWTNWPSYLSSLCAPILLSLFPWYSVVVGVFVASILWAAVRVPYANVTAAYTGCLFVTIFKWPVAIAGAYFSWLHGNWPLALVAIFWPIISGLCSIPGRAGIFEVMFAQQLGLLPADKKEQANDRADGRRDTKYKRHHESLTIAIPMSYAGFNGIAAIPVVIDPAVGMEVGLYWFDRTPFVRELCALRPFTLLLATAGVNTPYGPIVWLVFYVPNPKPAPQPFATVEYILNPADHEMVKMWRDLANQTHWHLTLVDAHSNPIDFFEFENVFGLGDALDNMEVCFAGMKVTDFRRAKEVFYDEHSLKEWFAQAKSDEWLGFSGGK